MKVAFFSPSSGPAVFWMQVFGLKGGPRAAEERPSGTKSGPRAAERARKAAQDRGMPSQSGGVRVTPPYSADTQITWESLDGRRSRRPPCFNYTIV